MAYTPATIRPPLVFFQASTPTVPRPAITAPLGATDTSINFNFQLLDYTGAVITEATVIGIQTDEGYTEGIYIPAGGVSVDGYSATGCVRGIRLSGQDITTGETALAVEHREGDEVSCMVSPVYEQILAGIFEDEIATGGKIFTLGDGTAGVFRIKLDNGTANFPYIGYDGAQWIASDDGISSYLLGGAGGAYTGGDGIIVLANVISVDTTDTTVFAKVAGDAAPDKAVVLNNSNYIDPAFYDPTVLFTGITQHSIYTPAFLTGGNAAQNVPANWLSVLNGSWNQTINGTPYSFTGVDFTGVTSMNDVAGVIQTTIRAATGGLETVVWSVDHLVISSVDTTITSAITVCSVQGGGTDISSATWMDCQTPNAVVTNAVVNKIADAGKIGVINSVGDIATNLLSDNLNEADTFFGITTMTGAQANTLVGGTASNADSLHTHDNIKAIGFNSGVTTFSYECPYAATGTLGWTFSSGGSLTVGGGSVTLTTGASTEYYMSNPSLTGLSAALSTIKISVEFYAYFTAGNVGIGGNTGASWSQGSCFRINAGNLEAFTAGSSSATTIISATPAAYKKYKIIYNPSPGSTTFYVDGVLVATHSGLTNVSLSNFRFMVFAGTASVPVFTRTF